MLYSSLATGEHTSMDVADSLVKIRTIQMLQHISWEKGSNVYRDYLHGHTYVVVCRFLLCMHLYLWPAMMVINNTAANAGN